MVYHSGQVSGQSVRSQENKVCQSTVCKRELSQLQRMHMVCQVVYQTMETFVVPTCKQL